LNALFVLLATAVVAYVSTNVDGYALLLGFFSNARYRVMEIVAGQFASTAAQIAVSIAIAQSGWVKDAPALGLAGVVPLVVGLRRIAGLKRLAGGNEQDAVDLVAAATGCWARIAAVALVATSSAVDNVLVYASLLIGRTTGDMVWVAIVFGLLTALWCACAFVMLRSRVSVHWLKMTAARVAPFMTTAIGASLLVRFNTLAWICSLA